MVDKAHQEVIVLGGGCFWCLDATYKLVKGITKVEEGYSGGRVKNPTDKQIYYENTGHAEVVRLTFDPKAITLDDILDIFFVVHDPTTIDRQGPDIGNQYRSVIFYLNNQQKEIVDSAIKRANMVWDNKVVTEVVKFENFYPASEYHKDYEILRPDYCQFIINPKLDKLKAKFSTFLK